MSDMDKVDAFLAKADEVIAEMETKFPGVRHVRTPQGLRRFSDAIGTPIEVNKPKKPKADTTVAAPADAPPLPPHKPLKPKHVATTPTEPIKVGNAKTSLPAKLVESLKRLSPRGTPDGAGTPDDPIDVGDDIPKAAKLLAEGKSIRMKDNRAVATLVDELAKIGNEARAAGTKAKDYDLCKVSVPGTNLFCYENKGIPRAEMPQFKGQAVPGSLADSKRKTDDLDEEVDVEDEYRAALDAMGVKITPKTVKASELKATQSQLVGTKVAGMSKAMEAGKIKDAPIFVTRDGYIIDGHHRWAAKVALDLQDGELGDVEMPVNEIDMEIGEAIDFANLFAKIVGLASKAGAGVGAKDIEVINGIEFKWNPLQRRDVNGRWVDVLHVHEATHIATGQNVGGSWLNCPACALENARRQKPINLGRFHGAHEMPKSLEDAFAEWADESKTLADEACASGACGWNEDTLLDAYLAKVEGIINP